MISNGYNSLSSIKSKTKPYPSFSVCSPKPIGFGCSQTSSVTDEVCEQIQITTRRIEECVTKKWGIVYKCDSCGHLMTTYGHCFIRYCTNCYETRFRRNYRKLSQITRNYPDVISHVILTMPRRLYRKEQKKELENAKRKFLQMLKRKGIQFSYLSVVDYGTPKKTDMKINLHIHMAIAVPYSFYLQPKFLQKLWARATGMRNAVIKIKKSRKKAVIRYFAKRSAGNFGHGQNHVYFCDFMGVFNYLQLVYRTKSFVFANPSGSHYSCNNSAHLSQFSYICDECGGYMRLEYIEYDGIIIYVPPS